MQPSRLMPLCTLRLSVAFTVALTCVAADTVTAAQLEHDAVLAWARGLNAAPPATPAPLNPALKECQPLPFQRWYWFNPLAWIDWAWSIGSPCVEAPGEDEISVHALVPPEEDRPVARTTNARFFSVTTNSSLPEWLPRSGLGDDYDTAFAAAGAFSLLVAGMAALSGGSRARINPLSRGASI